MIDDLRLHLACRGITTPTDVDIRDALHDLGFAAPVEEVHALLAELSGLGTLRPLLADPRVTDLVLNPDGRWWVDAGEGMEPAPTPPLDPLAAHDLCTLLAARCGVRLDQAMPAASGMLRNLPGLPDLRIQLLLSPPALDGCSLSIRVLGGPHTRGLDALGLPAEVTTLLREAVADRRSLLISGGTGAGKTTLLGALLAEAAPTERLILIEDTPELYINHPHVLSLTTREANADGAGRISMTDLLRWSLRMRPDRLIVGEIRGPEVVDLLLALNTGHAGSAGTLHANTAEAVPGRLIALGGLAGLDAPVVAAHAADALDLIVHLRRTPRGRVVDTIAELRPDRLHPLYTHPGSPQ